MTVIAFCDTETTGLDAYRNQIWEVGVVLVDPAKPDVIIGQHEWQVAAEDIDMRMAEPTALRIGQFYSRHVDYQSRSSSDWSDNKSIGAMKLAGQLATMLDDKILAGNVIDFDSRFLTSFLADNNQVATWQYHLLDVEVFAAGVLGLDPPWKGTFVSDRLGVRRPEVAHTALGDALWSYQLWLAAKARQKQMQAESELFTAERRGNKMPDDGQQGG